MTYHRHTAVPQAMIRDVIRTVTCARYALGHFADIVEKNERDGYFTVGPARDMSVNKVYIHIDTDALDPREVEGHQNEVPNGPSSEELARLFEAIFARYPNASAIGFATIPATDEGACHSRRSTG